MPQKTPLYQKHLEFKAEMIEWGSWLMPLQYTTILEEHECTRSAVSIFDTCHMGEFMIHGPEALQSLQNLVPRDLSDTQVGRCYYTHLCNERGGILDDVIIYRKTPDSFMMVVNADPAPRDFEWIKTHTSKQCYVEDISDSLGKIDLQGPDSLKTIVALWGHDEILQELPYFNFCELVIEGESVLISRTGYTGELGYEIYAPVSFIAHLWQQLLNAGVSPAGLGARDTLRLEMGYPLMGSDMNADLNPKEVGFPFLVSKNKNFIGQKAMSKLQKWWRIAFVIEKGGIARHDVFILDENKCEIGTVTSGTWSPTLKKAIGIALCKQSLALGTKILVKIRNRYVEGQIVSLPFVKETSLKRRHEYVHAST